MFLLGFEKVAKKHKKDDHTLRRLLLGNPASAALAAKSGKKEEAFSEAHGNIRKHQVKGLLQGLKAGALVGTIGGAALGATALKRGYSGKESLKHGLRGLGLGVGSGMIGGSAIGGIRGHLGHEATAIHRKYDKGN